MGLFSFPGKNQQDAEDDLDVPVKPRRSRRSQTQDEEPLDPMLPEKQRARRRLIGATALVLAAIIGLPMIFDADPNKPLADDVETQIPDKLSPLPESPAPQAAVQPAPQVITPGAAEVKTPAEPPAAAKAETVPDVRPAPESVQKLKPSAESLDKPAAEQTTERKAAPDGDKSQSKEKSRKFVLQVAAVNSQAKAEELQSRLKKSGIKAYWQKINAKDGERFRVRVGPFASREEAEKMQTRVKKAGLNGSVLSM